MMHLYCENLTSARVGCSVSWQEHHLLTRLHHTLLNTTGQDISDSLDLVDSGNWHAHWCAHWALWHAAHVVKNLEQGVHVESLLANEDIATLPPAHIRGLLQQVISHPSADRKDRGALFEKIFLPS